MSKRLICLLLVSITVLSAVAFSAAAESSYIRGDADGDGIVTVVDATAIQRKLVELSVVAFNERAADIDGKGLDITDATMIQRFLAELENPYLIGESVSIQKPSEDEYELPLIKG